MSDTAVQITPAPEFTYDEASLLRSAVKRYRESCEEGNDGMVMDGNTLKAVKVPIAPDHPIWGELDALEAKISQLIGHRLDVRAAEYQAAGAKSYGMFSLEGDLAVTRMVDRLLALPMTTTKEQLIAELQEQGEQIRHTHGEVQDTDVRDQVISTLNRHTRHDLSIFDF